jgi:Antitoxin component of bacterial toxin-antitoxin system, MqsA
MASKWNRQPCCLCGAGTLHDGVKTVPQQYKGQVFSSETHGAFCDHCADGFVMENEAEEARWLAFRDQVDAQQAA